MVDPDLLRSENRDPVAVRSASEPDVGRRGGDVGVSRRLTVVDVDVVDDYMGDVL